MSTTSQTVDNGNTPSRESAIPVKKITQVGEEVVFIYADEPRGLHFLHASGFEKELEIGYFELAE